MADHQLASQPRGTRAANEKRAEVQDVLDRMARALTTGDGAGVAGCWGAPAFVVSAEMVKAVASLDEVAAFFGGAADQYTSRGIVNTRGDIVDEEWIGDGIVTVKVRWPYLDAAGNEIGAEASDYTLRRNDAGKLEIRCVVMRGVIAGKP
ncbi:MAG: hypothetical protein WKG01_12510 [Kofleriaceae bacterium]